LKTADTETLIRKRNLLFQRTRAATSCLTTPGNACVAFSMIGDLEGAASRYGDRGYRYVHFEAGAIGQRMYLAAEAVLRKNSMHGIDPSFGCSVFAVCTRCFTRRDRGVKLPRHPPSLPLCNSFHDGRGPCAPGRSDREDRNEGRSRMSRCGSGACSDSTDR
jgi:hypothetical protein